MADKNYVGIFNCRDDPATVGTRWARWLTAFELYADGKGLIIKDNSATNKQQRRAQLLHFAGPDIQDIFRTLYDTGTVRDNDKAVTALNAYFVPKVNPAYARHAFRQMTQGQGETVLQFVTRLRAAAKDSYGEDTENQIRDEVLCKCCSDYLRRKLLEAGQELTLARTLDLAGQCEEVEMQMAKLSVDPVDPSSGHVNRVTRESGKLNGPKSRTRVGQQPQIGTTAATDVANWDISAATRHVQHVAKHAANVEEKIILLWFARQSSAHKVGCTVLQVPPNTILRLASPTATRQALSM